MRFFFKLQNCCLCTLRSRKRIVFDRHTCGTHGLINTCPRLHSSRPPCVPLIASKIVTFARANGVFRFFFRRPPRPPFPKDRRGVRRVVHTQVGGWSLGLDDEGATKGGQGQNRPVPSFVGFVENTDRRLRARGCRPRAGWGVLGAAGRRG